MKKRGQIFGQPFVYIFALIVIAVIIFFGINIIKDVLNLGGSIEFRSFVDKLRAEATRTYNLDYASVIKLDLKVPQDITKICFINRDFNVALDVSKLPVQIEEDVILRNNDNVFFVSSRNRDSIFIANLKPNENPQ